MLKVLMNRYHHGPSSVLLKFLPKDEALLASNQEINSTDFQAILNHPFDVLDRTHYSWLKPLIEEFAAPLCPYFISSLSPSQSQAIKKLYSDQLTIPRLAKSIKPFFLRALYKKFNADARLPIHFLPQTTLTPLANWQKQEIVELINFLGMHDLATEIRRVVSRNDLKNVYPCLSPHQISYLKMCMHQKEQFITPKLGLNFKEIDCKGLLKELHKRGIARLGKALSGQHPDLIWYIVHSLDIGRGKLLSQFIASQPIHKVTPTLIVQVTNLMNFLKKS